ncbi:HAD family hydrolase [Halorarum salinum]|uniref:HAD family hydrolase n=1 Tax=Halorarum salinum TaxID=2743089 RepID=A0A7D5LCW2_9EURY|nr:HAD family hydrolase [Halobaculum salinum]QLG63367.1 HAD family hydrolase [Halobaculum salinum]
MNPSAVTFDLDDTLVDYRRSPGEVLAVAFEAAGVDPLFPVGAYYDRFDEFNERTDSMAELRASCFAALSEERGHDPALGRRVADAFAASRDHRNVAWRPGAESLLDALEAAGVPTGVVTNGPRDAQSAKVEAVGLDGRVDPIVFAGHDTAPKPDPEPFERALERLGVDPERAVHVGDSRRTDVAGACAAGMGTVWVGEGDDHDADRGVRSLAELRRTGWLPGT